MAAQADAGPMPAVRRWQRVPRVRVVPLISVGFLAILVFVAVAAEYITPYDPVRNDLANALIPPAWVDGGSPDHLLGTDGFGRDVWTRLIYGARASLAVASFSLVLALVIGTVSGIVAGYVGGAVDSLLMRLVDVMLALPTILVALVVAIALGPSFLNLVLVVGLLTWPRIARLIRGETLLLRKLDFVRYSIAIAVPTRAILVRHIFPNIVPTLMVATTLEIGKVILLEASLSFLGAGLPPPTASWGVMIDDGRALIATGWWIALFPGLAIVATVLAFNAVGDWLRDYLDPKTRSV